MMIKFGIPRRRSLLFLLTAVFAALVLTMPASAQKKRPDYGGGFEGRGDDVGRGGRGRDRDRGRRRGRGGGVGIGIMLNFPPAVLDDDLFDSPRDDYEDEDDYEDYERPRRERRRRRPRQTRQRPEPRQPRRPRISINPPIPVAPPERFTPLSPPSTPPTPFRRSAATAEQEQFLQDEILVLVSGDNPDAVANTVAENFNLILLETLNFALLETTSVYRFGIPDQRPVATVLASVQNVPGIGIAAPHGIYRLQGDAGGAKDLQYALPKMRVPDAQAIAKGTGMSVAVIDSAVDVEHPSLKNADIEMVDVVKKGVEGPDMHGTAITGIIAASGDLTGIAPAAKIFAVRAFAPERLGTEPITTATTLATAVDQAFSRGARIFNMSFAGQREPLLIEIIDAAHDKGAVFVAAAGNEGPDAPPAFPAAHEKVIAITATDERDELYNRANQGGYVFAAAPGVDILAPVTGEGFEFLSGTSFAAAHVTGVIALLMERNPELTAETVRTALVDAAHDLGPEGLDSEFGAGLTDAYGSLLKVSKK